MGKEFDLTSATEGAKAEGTACLTKKDGVLDGSFLLNYTPFQLQEISQRMLTEAGPNLVISPAGNLAHFSFENKDGSTSTLDKERCSYDALYDIAPPWERK